MSNFAGFSKYGYNLKNNNINRHNSLLLATYYCGVDNVFNQLLDNYKNKDKYSNVIKINVINDYFWYKVYSRNSNNKNLYYTDSCNCIVLEKQDIGQEITSKYKYDDYSESSCNTIIMQKMDNDDEVSSKYYEDN